MCHVRIQFDGRDDAVWYDCQAKIVKHWSCLTSWYGVTALITATSQRSLVSTFPQAVTHGPRRPYSTMIRSSWITADEDNSKGPDIASTGLDRFFLKCEHRVSTTVRNAYGPGFEWRSAFEGNKSAPS
jgi:hypothetical protein